MTVYPGLHQFHREFDQSSKLERANKIVFITARPALFRDRTLKHLRDCGFVGATLLMGSFRTLIGSKRMARQKMQNFQQYKKIFPDYRFIFIGDNGQADIDLGKMLLDNGEVSHVWIHDIIRRSKGKVPYRCDECRAANIELFTSYIGAALLAVEKGIFEPDALVRVVDATERNLEKIDFQSETQRIDCERELLHDTNRVLEKIPKLVYTLSNPFRLV